MAYTKQVWISALMPFNISVSTAEIRRRPSARLEGDVLSQDQQRKVTRLWLFVQVFIGSIDPNRGNVSKLTLIPVSVESTMRQSRPRSTPQTVAQAAHQQHCRRTRKSGGLSIIDRFRQKLEDTVVRAANFPELTFCPGRALQGRALSSAISLCAALSPKPLNAADAATSRSRPHSTRLHEYQIPSRMDGLSRRARLPRIPPPAPAPAYLFFFGAAAARVTIVAIVAFVFRVPGEDDEFDLRPLRSLLNAILGNANRVPLLKSRQMPVVGTKRTRSLLQTFSSDAFPYRGRHVYQRRVRLFLRAALPTPDFSEVVPDAGIGHPRRKHTPSLLQSLLSVSFRGFFCANPTKQQKEDHETLRTGRGNVRRQSQSQKPTSRTSRTPTPPLEEISPRLPPILPILPARPSHRGCHVYNRGVPIFSEPGTCSRCQVNATLRKMRRRLVGGSHAAEAECRALPTQENVILVNIVYVPIAFVPSPPLRAGWVSRSLVLSTGSAATSVPAEKAERGSS
ncbi:hypothetical protein DFH06DRAFT_1293137 [Mycena polygramma]|nr:hypothetical protein DFH06DRAFT_1293137 [Mycena polygramma]